MLRTFQWVLLSFIFLGTIDARGSFQTPDEGGAGIFSTGAPETLGTPERGEFGERFSQMGTPKKMALAGVNILALVGSCGLSGLEVLSIAALDSIPITGIIADMHSAAFYGHHTHEKSLAVLGMGGLLSGIVDVGFMVADFSDDGRLEGEGAKSFPRFGEAYASTVHVAKNAFSEQSVCRAAWGRLETIFSRESWGRDVPEESSGGGGGSMQFKTMGME